MDEPHPDRWADRAKAADRVAERLWQWVLRIIGLILLVGEIQGMGRVYVLAAAGGMAGLPTIYNYALGKRVPK